jgi:hypothetical protein
LPIPRRPENRDQAAAALRHCQVEGSAQRGDLLVASDERRIEPPLEGLGALDDPYQPVRSDDIRLALERQRFDRLRLDGSSREAAGLLSDQDLAGPGRLLETRSDVDDVARSQPLLGSRDDFARIDARAELQGDAVVALELAVQGLQLRVQLCRRAKRAQRVVLVQGRHAEDGHDGVADELLDRASVVLDCAPGALEVARHHPAERLGVELLAQRGRARHVRKENGDRLADLPRGGRPELRAAGAAKARVVKVCPAAVRAIAHYLERTRARPAEIEPNRNFLREGGG